MRRPIKLAISQAIVPTGTLAEIYADKIYAVAGREYLKYRDIFDLWWLEQQGAALSGDALIAPLRQREALYPNGPPIDGKFAQILRARATEVASNKGVAALAADLQRWLALSGDRLLASPEHAQSIAERAAWHLAAAAETVALALQPGAPEPATESRRGRTAKRSRTRAARKPTQRR
jgi:hypothetical protein